MSRETSIQQIVKRKRRELYMQVEEDLEGQGAWVPVLPVYWIMVMLEHSRIWQEAQKEFERSKRKTSRP